MLRGCLLLLAILMPATLAHAADNPLLGFSSQEAEREHVLETEMVKHISTEDLRGWIEHLAAEPHHVGSEYGVQNAEFIASLFKEWGYDTTIESYEVLVPTPSVRIVELIEPETYSASLTERIVEGDASTRMRDSVLPPYNAFSPDGDVSAELVYVNYGIKEDYELLERHGIDVSGKIVIARYGRSWRGIKPKLAAEKGAIGALIYSDPADDGYGAGDVYPEGPYKNDSGVQRGAVMDLPLHAGDVLTPGWAATKRAKRLKISAAPGIPKIPVLPISYADAEPFLRNLAGPVAPSEWRGGLPLTYHLGPGPAKVRIVVEFDWSMVTANNVIAKLTGTELADEWVIRGNHHDAWNHGANDPVSGLASLLAEAKAIAALPERPKRTVVYAAWDAEEPGLIGSTEWAEDHAKELVRKAVAYINTDGSGRGFAHVGASHTLELFFNQVMRDVEDPQTKMSVGDRVRARIRVTGQDDAVAELEKRNNLRVSPLGSGSDYTPFLQHLGIASAHIAFWGESESGSYHTLYDTHEHYHRFVDPGNQYGAVLAELTGRATLRLANAPILPFDFAGFLDNVTKYAQEIEELADKRRAETQKINALIDDGSFEAALDRTKTLGPPKRHEPVPHFNFSPLKNALAALETAVANLQSLDAAAMDVRTRKKINQLLFTSERLMTREEGLPGREWYRHQIYAPGFYTGYAVKTLPAIREAIEERRYDAVPAAVETVASVLSDVAARVDAIREAGSM